MTARKGQSAKTVRRSRSSRAGAGAGAAGRYVKRALIALAVAALFGAALYGLFVLDARGPRSPATSDDGAPPIDHIDESSRDKLREILREEEGE